MTDWQPIATAPKDGTLILLADIQLYEGPEVFAAFWDEAGNTKYPWAFLDKDSAGAPRLNRMKSVLGPTHWMPFPSPDSIEARRPAVHGVDALQANGGEAP